MKKTYIDHSVFPDRESVDELKEEFSSDLERADYVERICSAWDFDIRPELPTFDLFRGWKDIFDQFPILNSPGYHTFRAMFRWEELKRVGGSFILPRYMVQDRFEERTDPCEHMI